MSILIESIFDNIVDVTANRLSNSGFKRQKSTFRLISGLNAAIVEFQKSRENTNQRILFTVNVAIVCGILLDSERLMIKKSRASDGHLRKRIGTFLPTRQDKWWEINNTTDGNALSIEVSDLICDLAVPYLLRYVDTSELVALWESGEAPGLTAGARISRLETLKGILEMDEAWFCQVNRLGSQLTQP